MKCQFIHRAGAEECNKEFDALQSAGRTTPDVKKRTELYVKAQRLLHEEAGLIQLAHRQRIAAAYERVTGYIPTPFGGNDFRAARVD